MALKNGYEPAAAIAIAGYHTAIESRIVSRFIVGIDNETTNIQNGGCRAMAGLEGLTFHPGARTVLAPLYHKSSFPPV